VQELSSTHPVGNAFTEATSDIEHHRASSSVIDDSITAGIRVVHDNHASLDASQLMVVSADGDDIKSIQHCSA